MTVIQKGTEERKPDPRRQQRDPLFSTKKRTGVLGFSSEDLTPLLCGDQKVRRGSNEYGPYKCFMRRKQVAMNTIQDS